MYHLCELYVCVYEYVCMYMYVCTYIYIHVTSLLIHPFRPRPCDQIINLRPNLF